MTVKTHISAIMKAVPRTLNFHSKMARDGRLRQWKVEMQALIFPPCNLILKEIHASATTFYFQRLNLPEKPREAGKSRWLKKLWMAGSFTSLALIKYDIPRISFYDGRTYDLSYAAGF